MNLPNASESSKRLNPELFHTGPPPVLEYDLGYAALATAQAEGGDSSRVLVHVTSVRKRLLDPDNLCEKYHLDCLRYAGILRDDTEAEISLKTDQRKAAKDEEEHTIITVENLPENPK